MLFASIKFVFSHLSVCTGNDNFVNDNDHGTMMTNKEKEVFLQLVEEYNALGINRQVDYDKFYLYSLITHSTAIEGSTVTEVENQLLFDEGISAKGKPMMEQLMNLDLKSAYEACKAMAEEHRPFSVRMLCELAALVMKHTGTAYSTLQGAFDSSRGDLRLVNVTAGAGGRSYTHYQKVPLCLEDYCKQMNERRVAASKNGDVVEQYLLSFDAHFLLVSIHPWVDGNGRMSRLIMNYLQFEYGLVPSKVEKEQKATYIQALIDSREQETLEPFRDFMFAEHARNLRNAIDVYRRSLDADPINDPINGEQDLINDPINGALLREIRRSGTQTYAVFATALGVSEATVKRRLNELKKRGLVRREGSNKVGRWIVCNK